MCAEVRLSSVGFVFGSCHSAKRNQRGCLLSPLRINEEGPGWGVDRCHSLCRDLPLNINTPCISSERHSIKQRNHNWPWVQGAAWLKHCGAWCDSQWGEVGWSRPPTSPGALTFCTNLWTLLLSSSKSLDLKCRTWRKPVWNEALLSQLRLSGWDEPGTGTGWKAILNSTMDKKQLWSGKSSVSTVCEHVSHRKDICIRSIYIHLSSIFFVSLWTNWRSSCLVIQVFFMPCWLWILKAALNTLSKVFSFSQYKKNATFEWLSEKNRHIRVCFQ